MKQYLDLVQSVLSSCSWQQNRTGIRTLSMPGAMMRFDLQQGFPAVTTKKLAFKSAMAELCGFLRAYDNAADFRALGCKVWDQNANENKEWLENPYRKGEDALGPIYGVQWRRWPAYSVAKLDSATAAKIGWDQDWGLFYSEIDQLGACLKTIVNDPSNRRILFHAWNPAELDAMALPPCHLLYQFLPNPETKELSMCLYVRSNDLGLGAPFNLAEGAALLHLVARLTGYKPKWFTYFIADAHIYETHYEMLDEQLMREPYPLPKLRISDRVPEYAKTGTFQPEWLNLIAPEDFTIEGYQHHPNLTAPMAV